MGLKELDKAIGKAFTMLQSKTDDIIKGVKENTSKSTKNHQDTRKLLDVLSDSVKKIPTKQQERIDYTKKFDEIKDKINNDDVVGALNDVVLAVEAIKTTKVQEIDTKRIEELLDEISKKEAVLNAPETQQIELTKKQLKILTPFAYSAVDCKIMNEQDGRVNPSIEEKQLPDNHNVTISNPTADPETGLATKDKQDDIITAIESQTGGVKWWYVRDTADATYEYTLFISTAGHIIRRETLSTEVIKQFTATETDDTTIDSNWSGRSGLSYTYV